MPRNNTRILLASTLATSCCWASEQSSVSLYGVVDTSVEWVNRVGPERDTLTRMPNLTGSSPSRLGLRGREDLGGGLSAQWALEMGIATDSGAINNGNRAFGRQAVLGLHGDWGSLSVGRQYNMLFWSMIGADVIGPSMHSMASLDGYIPNARADNSLAYRGRWGAWSAGATYSFGRDVVNAGPSPAGANCAGESALDKQRCREWSAAVQWDSPQGGVALGHLQQNGGPGAFAGLVSSQMQDRRSWLTGYAKFDQLKLGAGLIQRRNDAAATPRSQLWFLGATYQTGPWTLDSQLSQLRVAHSSDRGQLLVLRAAYHLSKRSAVYASLGHVRNRGQVAFSASAAAAGSLPLAGSQQSAVGAGLRHSF